MKVLFIPDVHQTYEGLEYAKKHVDEVDKIVFGGDYVDNWESENWWTTNQNPLKVIDAILEFKEAHKDKVELLIGNHDVSYMTPCEDGTHVSGHQWIHHAEIRNHLLKNSIEFKVGVELDGWVFSHAGFSSKWMDSLGKEVTKENLIETVNKMFTEQVTQIDWKGWGFFLDHCGFDGSGDDPDEGPVWIRPKSLAAHSLFEKQVVGHTEVNLIVNLPVGGIYVCDCHEHNIFGWIDTEKNTFTYKDFDEHEIVPQTCEVTQEQIDKCQTAYEERLEKLKRFGGYFF